MKRALSARLWSQTGAAMLIVLSVLLGLSLLIHPYSFFILLVPMGLLYLRARSRASTTGWSSPSRSRRSRSTPTGCTTPCPTGTTS